MPENFWITKVLTSNVDHRIFIIPRKCPPFVLAKGDALMLLESLSFRMYMRGVNGNDATRIFGKEPAGIVHIYNGASGKDHRTVSGWIKVFPDRNGHMLPTQQVGTYCMTPAHVPPPVTEWIVLIEQMIFALVIHK